jgi:hypothetical protein
VFIVFDIPYIVILCYNEKDVETVLDRQGEDKAYETYYSNPLLQ